MPLTANTVLIGRTSQSRNLHPEIALDGDTGVSRRHAQLVHSTEGTWTVVDLGSSNGTYVVAAGETPDDDIEAIPVGIPAPLVDQDAVYLGAWTKLTLRTDLTMASLAPKTPLIRRAGQGRPDHPRSLRHERSGTRAAHSLSTASRGRRPRRRRTCPGRR